MALNGLMHWGDQKYKPEEQIRAEYPDDPAGVPARANSRPISWRNCATCWSRSGKQPLIVRSSSLLEDNFGTSFAGKYESHFCPNQGTPEENLRDLTQAIIRIYASMLNPDALLYRRAKGLQDYDERMAILIQVVQGEQFGRYFCRMPPGWLSAATCTAGRRRSAGRMAFVRLVWGLGTRAVDRVGNDYPAPGGAQPPAAAPGSRGQSHPALLAAVCRPDRPGREHLQDAARRRRCCDPTTRRCATWRRSTRVITWRRCAACSAGSDEQEPGAHLR